MQQGGSIELKYEIPDELLKATPLSVSDVKFILEEQEEKNLGSSSSTSNNKVYTDINSYVKQFSQFDSEAALAGVKRELMEQYGFHEIEAVLVFNLCITDAEEAASLIPSLSRFEKPDLEQALNHVKEISSVPQ